MPVAAERAQSFQMADPKPADRFDRLTRSIENRNRAGARACRCPDYDEGAGTFLDE